LITTYKKEGGVDNAGLLSQEKTTTRKRGYRSGSLRAKREKEGKRLPVTGASTGRGVASRNICKKSTDRKEKPRTSGSGQGGGDGPRPKGRNRKKGKKKSRVTHLLMKKKRKKNKIELSRDTCREKRKAKKPRQLLTFSTAGEELRTEDGGGKGKPALGKGED